MLDGGDARGGSSQGTPKSRRDLARPHREDLGEHRRDPFIGVASVEVIPLEEWRRCPTRSSVPSAGTASANHCSPAASNVLTKVAARIRGGGRRRGDPRGEPGTHQRQLTASPAREFRTCAQESIDRAQHLRVDRVVVAKRAVEERSALRSKPGRVTLPEPTARVAVASYRRHDLGMEGPRGRGANRMATGGHRAGRSRRQSTLPASPAAPLSPPRGTGPHPPRDRRRGAGAPAAPDPRSTPDRMCTCRTPRQGTAHPRRAPGRPAVARRSSRLVLTCGERSEWSGRRCQSATTGRC